MKRTFFILILSWLLASFAIAQSIYPVHQLTQSSIVTNEGKIVVNSGGQITNAVSQMVFLRDSLYISVYDTVSASYKLSKKEFFTYDNGGLLLNKTEEVLGKNGVSWNKSQKVNYLYSGFQLFDETFMIWNKDLSVYENSTKNLYSFDLEGQLKNIFYQPWDAANSNWDYLTADVMEYGPNGKLTGIATQKWNKNLNRWDNYLRINFNYTSGTITEKIYQTWNTGTLVWDDYQKETFVVTGNTIDNTIYYTSGSGNWDNYLRKVIELENSYPKIITEYAWINAWKGTKKTLYAYNANNQIDELSIQNWATLLNSFRNNMLEKSYYSQREIFGINEKPQQEILIASPISSSQDFSIQGLDLNQQYLVECIALNGKVVFKSDYKAGQKIVFGSRVKAGVYLLHITAGKSFNKIQKIVVTH